MRRTVAEFFAHQLNIDPDFFQDVINACEKVTDKRRVLENFYEENQEKVRNIFSSLGLKYPTAEELFEALEKNIKHVDGKIFDLLDKPVCNTNEGCANLVGAVLALHEHKTGFFLKRKVAQNLLIKNPPQAIMRELGYDSVEDMLDNEDLFEIYAALRFMESPDWLNSTYIAEYRKLKKEDFEIRPVEIRVLDAKKWQKVTESFVHKKLHPMSHLKELGMIFIVPSQKINEVLTTYLFAMTSHYLDEVHLYSNYFRYYCEKEDFGEKIVSAIRGDIPDISLTKKDPYRWLVIQRYLFKDNPNDVRLGAPHINPEALYHRGASHTLVKMEKIAPSINFDIWRHTNYVAVWVPTMQGKAVLVNFNFMDNVMSLMNKLKFEERYYYHFHESLWNKIFINFFGVEKLEDTVIKHLLEGWFDVRKI